MDKVTVFLADDHSILRDGLKLILSGEPEYEVIGESVKDGAKDSFS